MLTRTTKSTILGFFASLLFPFFIFSQKQTVLDHVKGKQAFRDEVIYFYKENWEVFRKEAKAKGYISDFKMLTSEPDSNQMFDIFLFTEYPSEESLKNSEKNFDPILKLLRPNGPRMMIQRKREEILSRINTYQLKD